jgi:hypothetical protein
MRRLVLACCLLAWPATAAPAKKPATKTKKSAPAKKKKSKTPPAPPKKPAYPCSALPFAPVLLTSRVSREGELAHVVQELLVAPQTPVAPPGKSRPEDARFWISFGAPGVPRSLRVEFAPLAPGELAFPHGVAQRSRALVFAQAPDAEGACAVLGREREAGVVVQLPPDLRVDPRSHLAVLRVEQTLETSTTHDVVLRLATWTTGPVRLGPVQSKDPVQIELCGHGLEPVPLVGSPLYAAREAQHDLCVRWP